MNYLAHGYRFLDSSLMVAGTAVPDWLSVVDRKVRIRSRRVALHLDSLGTDDRCIADGMLQHLSDDDRFHRCPCFVMLEAELSLRFRRLMPDRFDHRPAFLGHIVTELMLDAVITERTPEILARYYSALDEVSATQVEALVNRVAARNTDRLSGFIEQFRASRFLFDYLDNERLLHRLNQVLRRVTLATLDDRSVAVLQDARGLLRSHADELLRAVELPV